MSTQGPRILFVSNGHGEDEIACKVLDELATLRPDVRIDAWPMVGRGEAYRKRMLDLVEAFNLLPSDGFATLDAGMMMRDLRHGWLRTHWRQLRKGFELRGRYDMLVGVGDIVPLLAGYVSRGAFAFIGCAKSAYYGDRPTYTWIERVLMRRCCLDVFPRDHKTHEELRGQGVPSRDLGNPMMDGLEIARPLRFDADVFPIAMLAGTRRDVPENCARLMSAAASIAEAGQAKGKRYLFLFALAPDADENAIDRAVMSAPAAEKWRRTEVIPEGFNPETKVYGGPEGALAVIAKGRFADILTASKLAIGMAGTGNEQAVGLGLPLVCAPSAGGQGANYVAMKAKYFGEAAVTASADADDIAHHAIRLMSDPERCRAMAAAGRERMGDPGASRDIAAAIAARLPGPA